MMVLYYGQNIKINLSSKLFNLINHNNGDYYETLNTHTIIDSSFLHYEFCSAKGYESKETTDHGNDAGFIHAIHDDGAYGG